jgi:hypothetical protein
MVEWASDASERTFNQSAANGMKEPSLPIFCIAANVRNRKTESSSCNFRLRVNLG